MCCRNLEILQTNMSHSATDSVAPRPKRHCVELAMSNKHLTDAMCLSVFKTLPPHALHTSSLCAPSPAEAVALQVIRNIFSLAGESCPRRFGFKLIACIIVHFWLSKLLWFVLRYITIKDKNISLLGTWETSFLRHRSWRIWNAMKCMYWVWLQICRRCLMYAMWIGTPVVRPCCDCPSVSTKCCQVSH